MSSSRVLAPGRAAARAQARIAPPPSAAALQAAGRRARTLLAALLAVDALLIALHVMQRLGWLHDAAFRLQQDGGVAEWWQYGQTASVAALLLALWRMRGPALYAAWAALFVYIVTDDALELHEQVGEWLAHAAALPPVGGLRPQDLGELMVLGCAGIVLVGGCLVAHWRCPDRVARGHSRVLLGLLGLLVVCGVFADMGQFAMAAAGLPLHGMTILEDGGEIVAVSLTLAVAARWFLATRATPRR